LNQEGDRATPDGGATAARLRALVIGSGGGGGVPQWNCGCRVCRLAWSGDPRVRPRTQSSLAVTVDGARWLLLNASIDLRQQVLATPALQPNGERRSSPIAAVLLTNADVDHAAGLLTLRERQPLTIWGTKSTLDTIGANRVFDVVGHDIAPRRAVRLGEPVEPLPGMRLELFAIPGKTPLWLEEGEVKTNEIGEGTVGVAIEAAGRRLVYAPASASVTHDLHARIAAAHALFFDGTLFADDEMIVNGLGEKTGRRMGHMPVSGPDGSLQELAHHTHVRRIFIHINNSNPILIEGSPEEAQVKAAGWEIAFDGMEVAP
jgi:pyrroloquinoline quinone biosynthesis protein B